MVWPIIRAIGLLILSGMSSFSFAERLYSPTIPRYSATSPASYDCNGNPQGATQTWFASSPAGTCSQMPQYKWGGVANGGANCQSANFILNTSAGAYGYCNAPVRYANGVTASFVALAGSMCPDGYTRDESKPADHAQACWMDRPDCQQGQTISSQVYCGAWSCNGTMEGAVCIGTLNINDGAFPLQIIKNSCVALLENVLPGNYADNESLVSGGGPLYCDGTYKLDGNQSNAPDTDSPGGLTSLPQSQACPTGTQMGQFNGQTVCVPCSTANCDGGGNPNPNPNPNPGNGSGDNGSGDNGSGDNGSGDDGGDGDGGDGSGPGGSGTCTAEQQAAGQCTGPGGGSCTAEQQAAGQCTGPGSNGNGGGGNGNGTGFYGGTDDCQTPPTCSGDPLTCGGIVQSWKDLCRMTRVTTDQRNAASARGVQARTAYTEGKAEKDGQVQGFFANFQNAVSSGQQGTCPSDITVTVMGKTITARLSQTCDFFRFFRLITLTIAYLGAAAIIFKAL